MSRAKPVAMRDAIVLSAPGLQSMQVTAVCFCSFDVMVEVYDSEEAPKRLHYGPHK